MLEVLTGIVSGIITGTGMGGGTILILFLTFLVGLDQRVAQATNLVFFIPTAIIASFVSAKEKLIDFKISTSILLFGVIGAIIGAKISIFMNIKMLKNFFGLFLLFVAGYEIYRIIKQYRIKKRTDNKIMDK